MLSLFASGLVLTSCATPAALRTDVVSHAADTPTVTVRAVDGADADIARIVAALPTARSRLRTADLLWRHEVTVTIHGSVHSFIKATGQTVPTLRAWSTWRAVQLLTIDSWQRDDDDEVGRRLTHELCHIGLWNRAGSIDRARRLPRFISEGVCSVVADQVEQRIAAADVAADLDTGRSIDFDDDSAFAYAVAHHVIAGLARCHGEAAVLKLVDDVLDSRGDTAIALARFLPVPPRQLIDCSTSSAADD